MLKQMRFLLREPFVKQQRMIKSLTPIRWLTLEWKGDKNGNDDDDVLAA